MKQFKFVSYLLVAVLCLGFTSCSSDDDYEINAENLLGTWQLTHSKGWEIYDGEKDEWDEDETYFFDAYLLEAGGTGLNLWGEGENRGETYLSWRLEGDKLTVKIFNETDILTVSSLSAKHIVLIKSGEDYYNEITLTRIEIEE